MFRTKGFTLVELVIAIGVIGILAAIAVVSYREHQVRAAETSLVSSLTNAGLIMNSTYALDGEYPAELPASATSHKDINLELNLNEYTFYDNLSEVQAGVLLANICQDLIDEGAGRGTNKGGATEDYITGCGNWNRGSMQVTGWTSKVFNTPITETTLNDYADSVPPGDNWHPERQKVTQAFYRQMHSRFLIQGGEYPITSFWDSWANSHNGGVMYESLDGQGMPKQSFCIEGSHDRLPNPRHITEDQTPYEGGCP